MENINVEKCDVMDVMNEIKMVGNPIDKLDFWFYTEEIEDEDGNPTVFHAYEGTGDNLLYEDMEQGFVDYINYEAYDGKITYSMIDAYGQGEDLDTMPNLESDGGMVLLYHPYSDLTAKQICWKVLEMSGVENPEKLTVRILTGKQADEKFRSGKWKPTYKCYVEILVDLGDGEVKWACKSKWLDSKEKALKWLRVIFGDRKLTYRLVTADFSNDGSYKIVGKEIADLQ